MGLRLSAPGLVCCAGNNREQLFDAALRGDQGWIKPFVISENRRFLAGLAGDGLKDSGGNRLFRMTAAALEQIRLEVEAAISEYGPDRVGVCAGTCDNGSELSLPAHESYFSGAGFPASYKLAFQSPQRIAEFIAGVLGVKGPCLTVATACSSSAGAIVKGAQLIEGGICDAVIAGGADLVSQTVMLGFASLEAVSAEICNPFSKNRKGTTLGEGAAFFVMRKDDSLPRQAAGSTLPHITLLGWGESADAYHLTAPMPDGSGARAAMREALNMAGLAPADVGYINLHGTGTPLNDSMEAAAVNAVFGDSAPPVSSTKPVSGHTLGAAGALELSLCWMALAQGGLPVHCWDGVPDPEIPALNFAAPGTTLANRICMSNSFAFGGCNVSLIIGRKD
jgi:3-oxoacyl-[acyl-carrier-protein] synthase-1